MKKNIFNTSFLILTTMLLHSCTTPCIQFSSKPNKGSEIKFFYKVVQAIDSNETYSHYLVVTNYNKRLLGKDLLVIAKNYIDTAKTDKPISDIVFVGQKTNGCLPDPYVNDNKLRSFYIIEFSFDNNYPENAGKPKPDLDSIILWKNGKGTIVYKDDPKFNNLLTSFF